MSKLKIEHPYANTPYDILSRPGNPKIGVLTPDASQVEVQEQIRKVLPACEGDEKAQAGRAYKILAYPPDRIDIDVFLRCPLTQPKELDNLAKLAGQPPIVPRVAVDLTAGLEFWLESPLEAEVPLQRMDVGKLTAYNDPCGDLPVLEFDS